ncbi:Rv3654c family TadE-like protein [Kocuria sp. M1R5S2]|uniref:Rv3654c family TadE-like protein n=1 Tax=Kocuria rhizosphaerae TaxID=3376285 RepID=UPI003799C2BB
MTETVPGTWRNRTRREREPVPRDAAGRARADDRGSGSVHALTLAMVLGVLLLAVLLLAQAGIAASRAGRAADLAALAAADTARGLVAGEPCAAARRAASDNGAQLELCRLVPPELVVVDVRTSVALGGPLAPFGPALGVSRAGPPPVG